MRDRVLNDVRFEEERSVWRLADDRTIPYTDGRRTEAYLTKVLRKAKNLSSTSTELERYILDDVTEYHLSHKRSQLLRAFDFGRTSKVLEVGCGCGAITRFLGETFDDVIGIEGGAARAGIARMRTRDLDSVRILNAPFQEVRFREPFDLIFCIGVFEYARAFVDAEDPYDHILKHLSSLLSPNGMLVLAIENQFGLKYFASSPEDHNGIMFDGIEGYHRKPNQARTFGYVELQDRIEGHFAETEFYFPYPDYKLPSCVISGQLLHRVDASELISQFICGGPTASGAYFDESLALTELARNRIIPFFSNSFLVVAGKGEISLRPDWLTVMFSTDRRQPRFRATTRIVDQDGTITVHKSLLSGEDSVRTGNVSVECCSQRWQQGRSLHAQLINKIRNGKTTLHDYVQLTMPWYRRLEELSVEEDGARMLDGRFVDAIWRNTFLYEDEVSFIDLEWHRNGRIPFSYVLIRAFFDFFRDLQSRPSLHFTADHGMVYGVIKRAARLYGLELTLDDFRYFMEIEAEMSYPESHQASQRVRRKLGLACRLASRPGTRTLGVLLRRACWLAGKLKKQVRIALG